MSGSDGARTEAYGEHGLKRLDRLGVYLSARAVRRSVDWNMKPRVVDLGCGYNAQLLCQLQPRITEGIGIDVRIANEIKQTPRLRFVEDTLERALPLLEAQSTDVVLALSVLEHVWEPLEALTQCHRVLRPGGHLLINVPTWRGKRALEFMAFRVGLAPALEMDDHKAYYDLRDLWPLLIRAGFRPSQVRLRRHKLGFSLFAVARKHA